MQPNDAEVVSADGDAGQEQRVGRLEDDDVLRERGEEAPEHGEERRIPRRIMRGGRRPWQIQVSIALPRRQRLAERDVHAIVEEDAYRPRAHRRLRDGNHDGSEQNGYEKIDAGRRRHASTPKRASFRWSVDGSMPSTSAARVLFPPSLCNTHMM